MRNTVGCLGLGDAVRVIKSMRQLFETWLGGVVTAENRQLPTAELPKGDAQLFFAVGFTNHREILAKCKQAEERWFYIREAARHFWTVEVLRKHIRAGDWRGQQEVYHGAGRRLLHT